MAVAWQGVWSDPRGPCFEMAPPPSAPYTTTVSGDETFVAPTATLSLGYPGGPFSILGVVSALNSPGLACWLASSVRPRAPPACKVSWLDSVALRAWVTGLEHSRGDAGRHTVHRLPGRQRSTPVCSRQWLSIFSAHRTFFRRSLKDSCFWPTESLCYQSDRPWPFWAVLTSEGLSPAVFSSYQSQTMGCCKSLPSFPQTFLYLGFFFTSGILPGGFLRSENLAQGLIPHQGILGASPLLELVVPTAAALIVSEWHPLRLNS